MFLQKNANIRILRLISYFIVLVTNRKAGNSVIQQTRSLYPMLDQCWSTVYDIDPTFGPTLGRCIVFSGICIQGRLRGFVKLKKIQKSEKNSKVGGWVAPIFWKCFMCFCVVFVFPIVSPLKKKWIGGWVGGVRPIRVFLGFLDFFQLEKTPYRQIEHC